MKYAESRRSIPRYLARWLRLAVVGSLACAVITGCRQGDTSVPPEEQQAPAAADVDQSLTAAPEPPSLRVPAALPGLGGDVMELPPPPSEPDDAGDAPTGPAVARQPAGRGGGQRSVLTSDSVTEPQSPASEDDGAVSVATIAGESLQLPSGLTAPQLVEFLGKADRELFRVANQVRSAADSQAATAELKRVAGLKLQAAERLLGDDDLPPNLMTSGQQGKLQALSHLSAMGDFNAANQLRSFAAELSTTTNDPRLLADSQMVLIGFALEDLQAGRLEDPSQIVDLVARLATNSEWLDMAALMAMGQARGVLQQYGYTEPSNQVRKQILDAFAAHPDPQIASTALQLAGSDQFDALQSLRSQLDAGDSVTTEQWQQAARELAGRAGDTSTVQYLASAGLQFEADGRDALADATYEVLQSEFASAEPPLSEEIQLVLRARAARREVIGKTLDVDLPDLQGASIDWSAYRGRIVVMPFWAAGYPPSLAILPALEKIQSQHPQSVAIVGVNVDFPDVALGQFMQQNPMDWPSLRSPESAEQGLGNPLAETMGLASMPFVAVIDPQGRVAAISLDGRGIEDAVAKLLNASKKP